MEAQRVEKAQAFSWKGLVMLTVFTLLPAIMFLIAGTVDWPGAWAYLVVSVLGTVGSRALVALKHPDLLAERGRSMGREDAKSWDKRLAPIVGLVGPLLMWVVAGLDRRWGWSVAPAPWLQWLAAGGILMGYALGTWAMLANRFFSGVVRIQTERGHTVASGGPYRFVRHPGYAGAVVAYLPLPVLLGTWWAYVPVVLTVAVLVVRTALEDQTLRAELPGYEAYAQQTRCRLLPGVW